MKNREQYRPDFHHTPAYGWMNDPNGMFYKDGVWNLYFQYNPYGSQWENMTWGHPTSTDLVHWKFQVPLSSQMQLVPFSAVLPLWIRIILLVWARVLLWLSTLRLVRTRHREWAYNTDNRQDLYKI